MFIQYCFHRASRIYQKPRPTDAQSLLKTLIVVLH
jgi:hypothetical protein